MLRSVIAVLAGLLVALALVLVLTYVAGVITGVGISDPPTAPYLTLNLVGSAIAGAAGGAVAVRVAHYAPHGHVVALAVVILLLALPATFSAPAPGQPSWYRVTISVLGPVSVLIGGILAIPRTPHHARSPAT